VGETESLRLKTKEPYRKEMIISAREVNAINYLPRVIIPQGGIYKVTIEEIE
jgi:hypothetical protein